MAARAGAAGQPSAMDRNLAGKRLGRYEVLTQIASGGMAGVYAGRAVGVAGFERLVAIKVLHPHLAYEEEFISMFLDEARLAARIRHPNVVATLDISDSDGDGYFIVMEYIEGDHFGGLLSKAARGGERLPTPVVVRVVVDALAGLSAAHNLLDETGAPLELVHRDVSPHNVMVGKDGISRLTDFGVAKAQVRLSSTRAGQFKGKLSYMAPEQASTGMADQRSDLFSMGIILWEGLTGRRLFRAENNAATLNKILREPIPMPSELYPELAPFDEVLGKALCRDPKERHQTADEMLEALEAVAQKMGGVASTRSVAKEVKRWDGEKLAAEAARLREAMDALGHTDLHEAQMPMPREGSVSRVSGRAPSPAGPEEPTMAARPENVAEQHRAKQRVRGLLALIVLLLVGGGVWLFWPGSEETATGAEATGVAVDQATAEADTTEAEPAADQATGAPSVAPDTTGTTTATDTVADVPEVAAPARTPRVHHRRHRRPPETGASMSPPTPARQEGPAVMHQAPPPDDLLANPYRR
ncbi:MAG: protein kinase [Deltaproteobacteria bacterium]|nr:protein kinase [Deltaproteobacteria bacterium]